MAESRPTRRRTLHLEYQFDRLLDPKLIQAYELLLPDQLWPAHDSQEVIHGQTGGDLRTRLVGSAERESHHPEPDRSSGRVREDTRIRSAFPVAVSGRGV